MEPLHIIQMGINVGVNGCMFVLASQPKPSRVEVHYFRALAVNGVCSFPSMNTDEILMEMQQRGFT